MTKVVAAPKKSADLESVWLDPFVIQYQMPSTLPCVVAIDHADRESRWFASHTSKSTDLGTDPILSARDSQQLDFAAWAPPLEHKPLLDFAEECLGDYLEKLPQADNFPLFSVQERYNVLKYEPEQAYHAVHADYSPNSGNSRSHLTFVCFLNTLAEGGELEFTQQGLQVQPVEGRAVIFPSGWTHAHRTLVASEDRYVFQLWWSFNA